MKQQIITSKDNPLIKKARSLHTKKGRKEHCLFLIEGKRAVLSCPKEQIEVLLIEEGAEKIESISNNIQILSSEVFKSISDTENSQGIIALAKIPVSKKPPTKPTNNILYLEEIQDPGNLGTIIRSAVAFDIKDLLLSEDSTDPYSPKVVRASMGAIHHLNVHQNSKLEDIQIPKFAAVSRGGINPKELPNDQPICLVLGNEGNGLSKETINLCQDKVTIKTSEKTESLNLAVAASILLSLAYERHTTLL